MKKPPKLFFKKKKKKRKPFRIGTRRQSTPLTCLYSKTFSKGDSSPKPIRRKGKKQRRMSKSPLNMPKPNFKTNFNLDLKKLIQKKKPSLPRNQLIPSSQTPRPPKRKKLFRISEIPKPTQNPLPTPNRSIFDHKLLRNTISTIPTRINDDLDSNSDPQQDHPLKDP